MSVYQVAVVFETVDDETATAVATSIQSGLVELEKQTYLENAKIAFTKFEKEATEVDSE